MTLLLNARDVAVALPVGESIDVLEEAFRLFASGVFTMPLRLVMRHETGLLAAMPAAGEKMIGVKIATVHPGNTAQQLPSVQALVVLLDADTGSTVAILDGTLLTLLRTAAASAVATRHLANPWPAVLCVLGSGPLAIAHIRAMGSVRNIREVRVFSPRLESRWAQVRQELTGLDTELIPCTSAAAAVRGANLIVLATSATSPIIEWRWITPGTHINAVGSHAPGHRELDSETVARSYVVCDAPEACWAEAGDLLIPEQEGRIARHQARVGLGEIVLHRAPGRQSASEVTVFKSVGLAFQDLWAGVRTWERARERGLGTLWNAP